MSYRITDIEIDAIDEYERDDGIIKILPNGQTFILQANRPDSRESGDYNSLSEELFTRATEKGDGYQFRLFNPDHSRYRDATPEQFLFRSAQEHLLRFGYNYFDAKGWATLISKGDYRADKCFPHSFFLSLAAHIQFSDPFQYQIQRPKYIEYADPKIAELTDPSPILFPIKVGAALPIIGWLDDYGDCIREEVTLLRKSSGSILPNKLSIPGGKTDDLLEITAWEEFLEEVKELVHPVTNQPIAYNQRPHRVGYQAIIDQLILLPSGEIRRYQADVFKIEIPLDTLSFLGTDHRDYPIAMHGTDGDGNGIWQIETLENVHNILEQNPTLLSPLARCTFQSYFDT